MSTDATTAPRDRTGHPAAIGSLVAVVAFVTALDNTIVTVALPAAARALRLGAGAVEWVGVSYLLAFAGLLLVSGAAVDRWGQRRMLLLGLSGFGLAAALGGAAPDAAWLIAARTGQGAAAALVLPATLAAIRTELPARARDTAAAVWTAALALALALGPPAGGLLTQYLHWSWVLWVNLPFAVAGLGLTVLALPGRKAGAPRPLPWRSAIPVTLVVLGGTALLISLADGPHPALLLGCGAGVLISLLALRRAERTAVVALLPKALLRDRVFAGSLILQLLWGLGVTGIFFFTPLYLQDALGRSPAAAGLPLLAVAGALIAASPLVAGAVRRFGVGAAVALGLAVVALGLLAVALPGTHPAIGELLPGLVLIGFGSAFTTPLASAALTAAGADQAGIAGGLLSADRELAGALGVALIGAVLALRRSAALAAGHPAAAAYAAGYLAGLLVAAGLAAVGAVLAVRLLGRRADRA
ncbi:MAG TPA: MFS transporter [Pseudonocardiaceae bacterium]|jgi:predicted MFS family arabinose efflux permease|nr:MFS transporter [Pseudonocardiaceae bacterium]